MLILPSNLDKRGSSILILASHLLKVIIVPSVARGWAFVTMEASCGWGAENNAISSPKGMSFGVKCSRCHAGYVLGHFVEIYVFIRPITDDSTVPFGWIRKMLLLFWGLVSWNRQSDSPGSLVKGRQLGWICLGWYCSWLSCDPSERWVVDLVALLYGNESPVCEQIRLCAEVAENVVWDGVRIGTIQIAYGLQGCKWRLFDCRADTRTVI